MGPQPVCHKACAFSIEGKPRRWIEDDGLGVPGFDERAARFHQGSLGERADGRVYRPDLAQHNCPRQMRAQSLDGRQPALL